MTLPQEIIAKKRNGETLTKEEISGFIEGFTSGALPEYQMSALAMAIYFQGMNSIETAALLKSMIASGHHYSWGKYEGKRTFVDKHSTGGVGDKTSLVILPLLVAHGLDVPMVAGRGLGHTGGTLDKLESIPGFTTKLDTHGFEEMIEKKHGVFGAQTESFVPADKKLYALRDVTATVESIPLITASIMSKKLGEGLQALVLDVKFGSGAFMDSYENSQALARSLVDAGDAAGCRTVAALTNMDEPLGTTAGNILEVLECMDILEGKGPEDTKELSLQLCAALAAAADGDDAGDASVRNAYYEKMKGYLDSGKAKEIFLDIAKAQGGDVSVLLERPEEWIKGDCIDIPVYADEGIVESIDTKQLGWATVELGGGRVKTSDEIDYRVGLYDMKKVGERVSSSVPICIVRAKNEESAKGAIERVKQAYVVGKREKPKQPLIREWISCD